MTAQNLRPTSLTLKSGHVVTALADGETWTATPIAPDVRPLRDDSLRNVLEQIAHRPGVGKAYGCTDEAGSFAIIYAILADIRASHGTAFHWTAVVVDGSVLILDELDDICCESRAWLTGGSVQPKVRIPCGTTDFETRARASAEEHDRCIVAAQFLAARHNAHLGQSGSLDPAPAKLPWSSTRVEDEIVVSDNAGTALFSFRGPRGIGEHETQFAEQTLALAA